MLMIPALVCAQMHSFDYEYLPHQEQQHHARARTNQAPSGSQVAYNATIQKCRCSANKVWTGSSCSTARTIVAVMNLDTNKVDSSPTDAFGVIVNTVQCSRNEVKFSLVPSRGYSDQFSLLPNGSLYWQKLAYDHYCLDHTLDNEGEMTWEADLCLPPPVVPRCCHSLAIASDGSCTAQSQEVFSPPVKVNQQTVQWQDGVPERGVSVTCKGYEKLLTLPLNTSMAHLTYSSGGISLEWSPGDSSSRIQVEGFCVESDLRRGSYNVTVCYEDQTAIHELFCNNATCVRKCCPEGEIMNGLQCVFTGGSFLWSPSFKDANEHETTVGRPEDLTFLYGVPTHCQLYQLDPGANVKDTFFLLNNGMLFHPRDEGIDETFPPTHYCIDNFWGQENNAEEKALTCFGMKPTKPVCSAVENKLYPSFLLISSVFLGITLIVYISVPEIRDKLHGRCLISLVAALFVGYTLLATTRLAAGTLSKAACSSLGKTNWLQIWQDF